MTLADRPRLLQVFANLLGNALKFTPGNGQISLGAEDWEDEVCFWISDTGPGIPKDQLDDLFTPLARAEGNERRCRSRVDDFQGDR
jgi:signal transduction histidine kinase